VRNAAIVVAPELFDGRHRRTGEIDCQQISRPADDLERPWRYVDSSQRFKLIIAFLTHPRMTNVIALEEFRIGWRAQEFATFWARAAPDKPFINGALRHGYVRCHMNLAVAGIESFSLLH
jgi:hypothetical protein